MRIEECGPAAQGRVVDHTMPATRAGVPSESRRRRQRIGKGGRWCAIAGRPTRFKPSSPSPTDAVRDGSAKLGHPVQKRDTRARPHAVAPMNCVPEDSRRRSTCTGRNAFSTRAC